MLQPRLTEWIPHKPTPKQAAFMVLPHLEAGYGGSAGGGKSDALLMAALQWVDVPGYAALLLRRTYADLALPGALMDRARTWLGGTSAHWNDTAKTWTFPSGATLSFGYLQAEQDKYRYQSAEFQYVGFDELTQFSEPMYRYLFSRLRRLVDAPVPIRMRWASNPGGVGHDWVKRRMIDEGAAHGRPFIPARLADNPYLDRDEYLRSLAELDPVTRAQLLDGSWIATPAGALFRRAWFDIADAQPKVVRARVRYWDLAGTKPKPGKDPDYTAGARVSRTPEGIWYIEHMVRLRGAPHEVEQAIRQAAVEDGRDVEVWLEQEPGASGLIVVDHYVREVLPGWTVQGQRSTGDKVSRAKPVAAQAANGNVRLVVGAWLTAFLDEAAAFPLGSNDDQVDAVSGGFARLADAIPAAMVGEGERAEADGDAVEDVAALRARLRVGDDAAYVLPSQRVRFWR